MRFRSIMCSSSKSSMLLCDMLFIKEKTPLLHNLLNSSFDKINSIT